MKKFKQLYLEGQGNLKKGIVIIFLKKPKNPATIFMNFPNAGLVFHLFLKKLFFNYSYT